MKLVLTFQETETNREEQVERPLFPESTLSLFNDYLEYATQMNSTRFAQELPNYKIAFRLQYVPTVTHQGNLPDDETFSAFLHKLRPLILQNERTEFTRVLSQLSQHINHPRFSLVSKEWKNEYFGKVLAEVASFNQGDLSLLSDHFLKLYLNAYEYHRDDNKRKSLEQFSNSFDPDARKGLVTLLLSLKLSAINKLKSRLHELVNLQKQENANQILDPTWTTPILKAESISQAGQD